MGTLIGIDLGTTYSAVARIDESGHPCIVKNGIGKTTTPSVLCFEQDGSVLFGQDAKEQQELGCSEVASFYKRNMGDPNSHLEYRGKVYTPTDLSSLFLKKLVDDVETVLGLEVDGAVITVPAYFAARERQATLDAAEQAGIRVIALLSEPSAAAYAYGLTGDDETKTVLIYDLGGGTFDVTIARIEKDKVSVLGCDGNHHLGGKDFDDVLASCLIEALCDVNDLDVEDMTLSSQEMNALVVQAEQVKRQLSTRSTVHVKLSFSSVTGIVEISRRQFEEASGYLLQTTFDVAEKLLSECKLSWDDIDGSLLVGGSTRMPAVSSFLERAIGKQPLSGINPDEAVALGAAIRANIDASSQHSSNAVPTYALCGAKELVDSTAHAMGMIAESPDRSRYINSVIIPKNSPIPACRKKEYSLRVPRRGGILEVYVLQGSNERVLDNDVYAKYRIEGIEFEDDGESIVEVLFRYTENATIEVEARQVSTQINLNVVAQQVEHDLSRFDGSPLAIEEERKKSQTDRIMLCVDVSGSMYGTPLQEAKKAILRFLDELVDTDILVGLMSFADDLHVHCEPTRDYNTVDQSCRSISIRGGTSAEPIGFWLSRFAGSSSQSQELMASGTQKENAESARFYHGCLIVLTDGEWVKQTEAVKSADAAADSGADIIAIGFGDADHAFLQRIATCPDYASLVDVSQLGEAFSTIGRAMASGDSLVLT